MKYRMYWHFPCKTNILHTWAEKEYTSPMEKLYHDAIVKTMEELKNKNDYELRKYAIEEALFKGRSYLSVALEVNYGSRTVQQWINDFIRDVGKSVGY